MAENPRIEELRRRVLADPASIAFAALAEEFRRVGRYEEAVDTCRTGLQRHPAYLSARVTLGRALIETGDYAGAREQLETVLRSAPENLAAIRGLAQIEEHLGHSTEMDPHLADMMQVMHEESLRAAAARVPVVSVPVVSEPVVSVPVVSEPAPVEAKIELASVPEPKVADVSRVPQSEAPRSKPPEAAPAVDAATPEDLFASYAPASSTRAPSHDVSFDLSNAFSVPRKADPVPEAPIVSMTPPRVEPVPEPVFLAEPASELDLEPALDAGPDPEVLATLARLERFLGAIQSLRA
jgi:tetratricopeptide (TPR) repeat protein